MAAAALALLPTARGATTFTLPLLAIAGTALAATAVLRGTAGVDAAVAGDANVVAVVHALGDGLEAFIPLAMLGMLGIAVAELRDAASRMPRWSNIVATAFLGLAFLSSAASAWAGIGAADALQITFVVPLLWLVAFGATQVRGAADGRPAARATFAVQER
jgi:hypothetical protein